ncbi:nonsense-mediated mRNA decay protein 2-like [Drosophila willistoni]|uniref:nonsense-mediated mRNA decay protein 2-like n=1 Tax=Drosophila willistoni TaxID=7260 RepID=UPI001F0802DB|nr:nonsense-mediated mRNA decay protein 2-like [Drosophila willistoni]
MFRSSENANIDQAVDMCKEMVEDIDDCLKSLQLGWDNDDAAFAPIAEEDEDDDEDDDDDDDMDMDMDMDMEDEEEEDEEDEDEDDEDEEEDDEEADLPQCPVELCKIVVADQNQIKASKIKEMELIFDNNNVLDLDVDHIQVMQKAIEEEIKHKLLELVEPELIEEGRTYNELDKVYKDLSVKCIKLRRDLESSSTQLMHISDMADRTKDIAQLIAKFW